MPNANRAWILVQYPEIFEALVLPPTFVFLQ